MSDLWHHGDHGFVIHDSIFAQASCDIIRQTDEEVFAACGADFKAPTGTNTCSACGWLVCITCGKHVMGNGKCPVSLVSKIMED